MNKCQSHKTFYNEERIVFEEINRWQRYTISTLWLVTSFFISLNFLIIHAVLSKESIFNALRQSVWWGLAFTVFCAVQYITSLVLLIVSVNLTGLMSKKDNNSFQIEKFAQALKVKLSDFLSIEKMRKAIATSWGILSTAYTMLFIVAWWILVYN